MRQLIVLLFCFFVCIEIVSSQDKTQSPLVSSEEIDLVIESNKKWLDQLDNRKYATTWKSSDQLIQQSVSETEWESAISSVHEMFGSMLSRDILSADYHAELPGSPDGNYIVVQFETSFQNKELSIETVVSSKGDDGVWRVAGYFIK